MPRIAASDLEKHLDQLKTSGGKINQTGQAGLVAFYLIFGDEMVYKSALRQLLDVLVPGEQKTLNYESIEGDLENISQAVESVNTFSMMPGNKVVALIDSKIFSAKQDHGNIIEKAWLAFENKDLKKAAGLVLNLLGTLGLTLEDAINENAMDSIIKREGNRPEGDWIKGILNHCVEKNLTVPDQKSHEAILMRVLEKGLPRGNYFVITTDFVDKRRNLYKKFEQCGMVVDCSVPKGNRRADRIAQEEILRDKKNALLSKHDKKMEKEAFQALYEMTGFELRTFVNSLEKLVSYVGDRKRITPEDVKFVLKRTRTDPIYAFTNAVTDKNVQDALYYLDSLLSDGQNPIRPEQIVVAIANQLRMLLLIQEFRGSAHGKSWFSGCTYQHFKNNVMPAIQVYDQDLLSHTEKIVQSLSEAGDEKPGKKKTKKKKDTTTLLIAKNQYNPYPVFQMMKKSEKFSQTRLVRAFEILRLADRRIKTTGSNKKLILEKIIMSICGD